VWLQHLRAKVCVLLGVGTVLLLTLQNVHKTLGAVRWLGDMVPALAPSAQVGRILSARGVALLPAAARLPHPWRLPTPRIQSHYIERYEVGLWEPRGRTLWPSRQLTACGAAASTEQDALAQIRDVKSWLEWIDRTSESDKMPAGEAYAAIRKLSEVRRS
jgi:hypothetical protein